MSGQIPDLNAGALAPVADEVDLFDLPVTGRIPRELDGLLIRNGPNPRSGRHDGDSMLDWWLGSGMLHGLRLSDGTATWYRNRWTETDTNVNVNVVGHGGRILALGEGAPPAEIDRELRTRGPVTFGVALPGGMTAHPKIDPDSGRLRFFRSDWQPPFLVLGSVSPDGTGVSPLRTVELDRPVMMHDFAITQRFDVILDLNVVLDLALLDHGAPMPLRWDADHHTALWLMPHDGGPAQRFEIEPCFVQHVVNAYEVPDGGAGRVVLDVVRYRRFLEFDMASGRHRPNPLGVLWRYELRLGDGSVVERQLDDRAVELPRIDERLTGRRHRRVFAVEQPTDQEMRGIVAYDLDTGRQDRFPVPVGDQNSEPVFVPADGERDGRGWLLVSVYRSDRDENDVVVLDAGDLSAPPLATIALPRRIPAGFHGAWIPFTD